MALARIVSHYFHHDAWLADGQLLRDAGRLARIPGVLIHGRFDLGGPADTAWLLARRGRTPSCTWSRPVTPAARR
jgi:proline iminopeptidase